MESGICLIKIPSKSYWYKNIDSSDSRKSALELNENHNSGDIDQCNWNELLFYFLPKYFLKILFNIWTKYPKFEYKLSKNSTEPPPVKELQL